MLSSKMLTMPTLNMKKRFDLKKIFTLVIICSASCLACAQSTGITKKMAALKIAIAKNPDKLALQEAFISESIANSPDAKVNAPLLEQYEVWMKKYPNSATLPYAIGHALADAQNTKAKTFLLQAVKIDPKFDKAYYDLWHYSELKGEFAAARDYMLKAKEAAPDNAEYNFYYAFTFRNVNFEKYRALSLAVADKFPNTERAAQSLYWLASETEGNANKMSTFERLKTSYSPANFRWSSSGMQAYFSALIETAPSNALTLSNEMLSVRSKHIDKEEWLLNKAFADQVVAIDSFLNVGKPSEAAKLSGDLKAPEHYNLEDFVELLKSRVLFKNGNERQAYANLVEMVAKKPTKPFIDALQVYGNHFGKSASQINAAVVKFRDSTAKTAPEFDLENYLTKGRTKLSDYKGKVVLLTYWFPGCGPCRREFPYFEKVVKQFSDKNLAYLGINIVPKEDTAVLPFLTGSGYSFIPLKDNDEWVKGPLENNHAAPFNVLIDQDGKIIFSGFEIGRGNEVLLHTMINSLLDKNKTS